MTLAEFKGTTSEKKVPSALSPGLRALWHDAKGDWDTAHEVAQNIEGATGAWIHAYLHRKERDLANAGYWYRRAGKPECREPLEAEWDHIATALLAER